MIRKIILFLFLITGLAINSYAQPTTITFRVNMSEKVAQNAFVPSSEFVDLAGNFNGWGSSPTLFADPDGDLIYDAQVNLTVGQVIEFKARINGQWNGREEFPGGGPNRSYLVQENGIVEFWYNDEIPADALIAEVFADKRFTEPGSAIRFFDLSGGDPVAWKWNFPGGEPATSAQPNPVITYPQTGIFDVSLTIFNSSGDSATVFFPNYIRSGPMDLYEWNDEVFYEIFVRSFKDSDGDGIGDFQGLIQELDYLNDGDPNTDTDLGITGIWLMPIAQSPSYHGYDVMDYRSIESDYGTQADFLEFMDEAHARGIRVIVDYVMNHASSQHPWFVESRNPASPYRDWFVWEGQNPGFTGPWGQPVWHAGGGDYYYGLFWSGMPDLNYKTPAVRNEMFDIARYWLEDMGVDGFRLDAVKFIYEDGNQLEDTPATLQFWKDFRTHYKSVRPDAFCVGEAWTSTLGAKEYVNDGGLDYCFEFDLAGAILHAVNSGEKSSLENKIGEVNVSYPFAQYGTFLTNHDINRVMDQLGEDASKAGLAAELLLTFPGIPYLYYGEEIGMTGTKPDEDIRKPLQWNDSPHAGFTTGTPWRSVNSDYRDKNIAAQQADPNSLWHRYRDMIALRNQNPALRRGEYFQVRSGADGVLAFLRKTPEQALLVVANLTDASVEDPEILVPVYDLPTGFYRLREITGSSSSLFPRPSGVDFQTVTLPNLPTRRVKVFELEPGAPGPGTAPDELSVYPNPTNGMLHLRLEGNAMGLYEYQIIDPAGRVLRTASFVQTEGSQEHAFHLEGLADGLYFLRIRGGDNRWTQRFVVQK